MLVFTKIGFAFLGFLIWLGSHNNWGLTANQGAGKIKSKSPVTGSRIAWDYSSMRKVSAAATGARYNGYARLIQRHDKTLICVYESDGNILTVRSNDLGNTWSEPVTVASKPAGFNLAVPDILELHDKSLLVCYNPRPHAIDPARRFGIRTKKSYDGGLTWTDERLLYQAGYQFENGCWEPAAIQLPNNEIQLYFANEGPYTQSDEQNISLLRSTDNGLSWTQQPEIVSFRAGKRDGMPAPLLLQQNKGLVVAIEDNGSGNFKPYIIRSTVAGNWAQTVTGSSPERSYALAEKLNDAVYAGAPYLRQLKTGETILSYQGTEGRPNKLVNAEMKVVLGTNEARNFNRKTVPFVLPPNKSGLWNSLSVLADNTVIALTSTNAYSANGNREVWMIKGVVIPELKAQYNKISVARVPNETGWSAAFPIFIGHKSPTQVTSQVIYDNHYLYVRSRVKDKNISTDSSVSEENDGVSVQIDAANTAYEKPDKGVFTFFLSAANILTVKEGLDGAWIELKNTARLKATCKITAVGYVQELAIPWSLVGGKPARNKRIGFNICLTENPGHNGKTYSESISGNNPDQPFTWMTLQLK